MINEKDSSGRGAAIVIDVTSRLSWGGGRVSPSSILREIEAHPGPEPKSNDPQCRLRQ